MPPSAARISIISDSMFYSNMSRFNLSLSLPIIMAKQTSGATAPIVIQVLIGILMVHYSSPRAKAANVYHS